MLNANPLSPLGRWCQQRLGGQAVDTGESGLPSLLWQAAHRPAGPEGQGAAMEKQIRAFLARRPAAESLAEPPKLDHRIRDCLQRLHAAKDVPAAAEMARQLFLSESRFLHLFKQETGLTYRRMVLWFRLAAAFRDYPRFKNLTALAHHCGFVDSTHFARAFKAAFGISPGKLLKNSRFIQAKAPR